MRDVAAEPYRKIDFSRAKRGPIIPFDPGKTKISLRLDNRVINHFRAIVEKAGWELNESRSLPNKFAS
jgi:uncharacterized protein (DUF4415 family)